MTPKCLLQWRRVSRLSRLSIAKKLGRILANGIVPGSYMLQCFVSSLPVLQSPSFLAVLPPPCVFRLQSAKQLAFFLSAEAKMRIRMQRSTTDIPASEISPDLRLPLEINL